MYWSSIPTDALLTIAEIAIFLHEELQLLLVRCEDHNVWQAPRYQGLLTITGQNENVKMLGAADFRIGHVLHNSRLT